jgi:hypothetical protein
MNMYLAAILGLCMLTNSPVAALVSPAQLLALMQQDQPQTETSPPSSPQQPTENSQPVAPTQDGSQPNQGTEPEKTGPAKTAPEKTGTQEVPPQEPAPPAQKPPSQKPPKQSAPKSKKTSTKKLRKKPTETASTGSAEKKVVKNGGTVDPAVQLAPSVSVEQASQQRNSTSQLLATTDTNLKQLSTRQLTVTQQDSVSQIRKYMEQAKTAEAAGDVQRAQNLASKALMLSDDLVKH